MKCTTKYYVRLKVVRSLKMFIEKCEVFATLHKDSLILILSYIVYGYGCTVFKI